VTNAGVPEWATIATEVKPGEWLYERPIGTVSSGESGKETRVGVLQRSDGEPCIKVGDVWLTPGEADLLVTMIQGGRKVITPRSPMLRAVGG